VDHARFHPDDSGDDGTARARVGVAPPYVAFLGTLEPRKDPATLVAAFDEVAGGNPELQLVIAGGSGWGNERFETAVAASPYRDRILRTGYLEQIVVPVLLRRAEAVVYPAIEEGFGLPALEALACGAPLITTAGSVMEEVAGGAATVFAAGDVPALAGEIEALLERGPSPDRRALGLEVASRFTWEATAEAHEAVYASVAGTTAGRR